jgi:hypothetical protein
VHLLEVEVERAELDVLGQQQQQQQQWKRVNGSRPGPWAGGARLCAQPVGRVLCLCVGHAVAIIRHHGPHWDLHPAAHCRGSPGPYVHRSQIMTRVNNGR